MQRRVCRCPLSSAPRRGLLQRCSAHLSGALCRSKCFAEAAGNPEARFFCCHVLVSSDGEEQHGLLCGAQPRVCLAHMTLAALRRSPVHEHPWPCRCLGSSKPRAADQGQGGILKHLACSVTKDVEAHWAAVRRHCLPVVVPFLVIDSLGSQVCCGMPSRAPCSRAQAAQEAHAMQMQGRLDEYRDAFLFVDTGTPGWRILHLNQAAIDRLGEPSSGVPRSNCSASAARLTGVGKPVQGFQSPLCAGAVSGTSSARLTRLH